MVAVSDQQRRLLEYVADTTESYDACMSERCGVPAARSRDTFVEHLRNAFDAALANCWIEPVTEYRITDAGRAALTILAKATS